MGDLNRRMGDARRLDRDAATLQTEVASLESQEELLSTQLALATGEVLVENWARSEARMIRPGEHLIIPKPDPGVEIAPTPRPLIEDKPPSPLEIWLALLIG